MSPANDTLRLAMQHHRAGDLRQAEQLYLQVLAREPDNADAHHLLGMAAMVQGQSQRAVEHFERAVQHNEQSVDFRHHLGVALSTAGRKQQAVEVLHQAHNQQPKSAPICNDLAGALRDAGQLAEAEACFREAVRLDPQMVEAHNNLGNLLHEKRDWEAAIASLDTAARLRPTAVEVHFNLGNCYQSQGRWSEAEIAYQKAIDIKPDLTAAHAQLGDVLFRQQRYAEAKASYREAMRLEPLLVEAMVGMGMTLQSVEQFAEAEQYYRRALELRPDDLQALYNLGGVLFAQREYAQAAVHLSAVTDRSPEQPELHFRLGQCLQFEGRFDEAIAEHSRAIAGDLENAEYHYYRAAAWLTSGDFEHGWPEYEWRLKTQYAAPPYPQPRWQGDDLHGQGIVVSAEWGLGDTLHFARYVPMVRERGGNVFLAVQSVLVPLLDESGFTQFVPLHGAHTPQCKWQAPLLSLPGIFRTTLETIPATIPYLTAKPALVDKWHQRLRAYDGLKVGIHWHGSKAWSTDARSIPLVAFEPLARVPGVTLISLQKNDDARQIEQLGDRFGVVDFGDELDAAGGAFMDTAAIMKSLDLVITCDTSTAHLAGALGVPVWVALNRGVEWRWMWDREDTPWYPGMRLFRQSRPNDWAGVFQRMAEQLGRIVRAEA